MKQILLALIFGFSMRVGAAGCLVDQFWVGSDKLLSVGPVGHLLPDNGSHIFPEIWNYLYLNKEPGIFAPFCPSHAATDFRQIVADVRIPTNMDITQVVRTTYYSPTSSGHTAYTICGDFTNTECSGISQCITDVNELYPGFASLFDFSVCPSIETWTPYYGSSTDRIYTCALRLYHPVGTPVHVDSGMVVGKIGGGTGTGCSIDDSRGINLRTYDRTTTSTFTDNADYGGDTGFLYSTCGMRFVPTTFLFHYGTGDTRAGTFTPTNHPDPCGTYVYDNGVAAIGNWSTVARIPPDGWNLQAKERQFALVYDELDIGIPLIMGYDFISGVHDYRGITFPLGSPLQPEVRPAFEKMRKKGQTYCFDQLQDRFNAFATVSGRILIKFQNINNMTVEHQPSSDCSTFPWSLTSAARSYYR